MERVGEVHGCRLVIQFENNCVCCLLVRSIDAVCCGIDCLLEWLLSSCTS